MGGVPGGKSLRAVGEDAADAFTHALFQAMERIVAGKEFGEAALKKAELMESQMRKAKHLASEP